MEISLLEIERPKKTTFNTTFFTHSSNCVPNTNFYRTSVFSSSPIYLVQVKLILLFCPDLNVCAHHTLKISSIRFVAKPFQLENYLSIQLLILLAFFFLSYFQYYCSTLSNYRLISSIKQRSTIQFQKEKWRYNSYTKIRYQLF